MTPRPAILIVDHGSRREEANAQLEAIAELVRALAPETIVELAHMELAAPSIAEALAACRRRGATEVVVVPYFLSTGRHVTEDIPRLVAQAARDHPEVRVRVTGALGPDRLLAALVVERAALGAMALWRQDDNGNRFKVEVFADPHAARAALARFEALGHKQHYWLEPENAK